MPKKILILSMITLLFLTGCSGLKPGLDTYTMPDKKETVQLYMANILTAEEAVERLRYNKVNNQVSFHTEKALQYVKLVRRVSYARKDI